jgi:hypothetical protein
MNLNGILPKITYKQILALIIGLGSIPGTYLVYRLFLGQNQPKLGVLSTLATANVVDAVQKIANTGSSVSQTFKEELDKEFNQLLEKVQQEFPLTDQIWQNALNKLESLKRDDNLLAKNPVFIPNANENPLVQKVRELLVSYKIDPRVVTIETIDDPKNGSYAFAGQYCIDTKVMHSIKLNLAQLPKQTPAIQEALLRHEIMHLLNYDPLTFGIIEKILKENGISAKEFWANDAFSEFHKFIEYRADLLASLNGVSTAQALQESFVEHMNRYKDSKSRTHPTCQQRYAVVDNLVQYMNVENKLELA